MVKLIRGVLIFGAFSTLVYLLSLIPDFGNIMGFDRSIFNFLGIVLSILLVFRTNTAYDRWWEGRKQWGSLVNHCRNLAIQLHVCIPEGDMDSRYYFNKHIANFCIAFKEHLRNGTNISELLSLSAKEVEHYKTLKHVPNAISLEIQHRVQNLHRTDQISGFDHINIKTHTQALLDILGACERIKKTPIPFSYAVFIRLFIMAYCTLLPFSLMSDLGMAAILITMFVSFAFLGIEMMAGEIEDPFGLDCNDLPTGTIATNIHKDISEIFGLQVKSVAEPELYQKIF
jgi:putative membrane protein